MTLHCEGEVAVFLLLWLDLIHERDGVKSHDRTGHGMLYSTVVLSWQHCTD